MKRTLLKKILSVVCVATLGVGLVGCGSTTESENPKTDNAATENSQTDGNEDVPVVKMGFPSIVELTDLEQVQDAINEVMVKEAGAKLEIVAMDFGNYTTQLKMMLSTGEDELDIFHPYYAFPLTTLANNKQVLALDDLLEEYGQGILETIDPEYIDCGKIDGTTYTLPIANAYSSSIAYIMRKDVADELGIVPEEIKNLDDLTDVLAKAKELHPELTMIPTSSSGWFTDNTVDYLSDKNMLGVLLNYGQDLKVENYYASDRYKELCEYAKKWQDAGFFADDPLNNANGAMAAVTNGEAVGCFTDRYSAEACVMDYTTTMGREIVAFELANPLLTTSKVIHNNWCIAASCKNPEAAMKVLNVMYTNETVANLLMNGIEGVTYQVTPEGNLSYMEGKDMFSAGWCTGMSFFWPNKLITKPFAPQTEAYYQNMKESNDVAIRSKALGFNFDGTTVADEITACTNVVNQYNYPLLAGVVDYEEALPKFLKELEDAGIQDIIAEKQKQLDAWAEQQ